LTNTESRTIITYLMVILYQKVENFTD